MKTNIKQILREGLIMEERIKFNLTIPQDISELNDIFKRNGFDLYIVGGAIRDALLGTTPKDYDLVTNATPDKVEELMRTNGIKTLATGKSFGVINVFTDEGEYEVATYRSDGPGRKPEVKIGGTIKTDAQRRDLTINAIYYDIDKNEIVDLVGGVTDLKNGVVRTVGSAEDRFRDDRLRILRAIRFASRFGSQLDPQTDAALKKDASLEGISGERIRDEFIKGITSSKSTSGFLLLIDKYNLFDWVFNGLNVDKSVFSGNDNYKFTDYIVVLALLLKKNNLMTLGKRLNALNYSTNEVKGISFLIALMSLNEATAYSLKKVQKNSGVTNDQIRYFGSNAGISSQLLDAFEAFNLTVTGPQAMEITGLKPGPELGNAIEKIETDNFKKLL
jgi:tRNA nucleotidyltransferase/poly(A) polymerase